MAARKLTNEQVIQARQMYRDGQSFANVGLVFSLSMTTAMDMIRGKTYAHVPQPVKEDEIHEQTRRGSFAAHSILDEEIVIDIKERLLRGEQPQAISKILSVRPESIHSIARGDSWKHVGPAIKMDFSKNKAMGNRSHHRPNAKLTDTQISYIKAHIKVGVAVLLVAKYFKVSYQIVYGIARNLTWKHVKPAKNPPPLILSTERELPIRLRGERLNQAFREWNPNKPYQELAEALNRAS